MIYIAYLLVTGPMLLARLRGKWRPEDAPEGYFSLGKWGLPINIAAVGWGIAMALNLAWPRASIYNATEPFHWYLKWGAFVFIGFVMIAGFAHYWFIQRHKTGTLAAHAHVSDPDAPRRRRSPEAPATKSDDVADFIRRHPPFDTLDASGLDGWPRRRRSSPTPRARRSSRAPTRHRSTRT